MRWTLELAHSGGRLSLEKIIPAEEDLEYHAFQATHYTAEAAALQAQAETAEPEEAARLNAQAAIYREMVNAHLATRTRKVRLAEQYRSEAGEILTLTAEIPDEGWTELQRCKALDLAVDHSDPLTPRRNELTYRDYLLKVCVGEVTRSDGKKIPAEQLRSTDAGDGPKDYLWRDLSRIAEPSPDFFLFALSSARTGSMGTTSST